jgi:hypothetical protein
LLVLNQLVPLVVLILLLVPSPDLSRALTFDLCSYTLNPDLLISSFYGKYSYLIFIYHFSK